MGTRSTDRADRRLSAWVAHQVHGGDVGKAPTLPHASEAVLPDGRRLTPGREFSVPKRGRFSFRYLYEPDGSLTAFGPLDDDGRPKGTARLRSFRPDAVATVHHQRKVEA